MDKVAVTQADREAAANYASRHTKGSLFEQEAPSMRRGLLDDWEIVQALARHRIQAAEAVREACAAVADDAFADTGWSAHYKNAAATIASAIRSLDLSSIIEGVK